MDSFARVTAWLLDLQRAIYADLAGPMAGMANDSAMAARALGFALLLGAVHAMTPGHGKSIVFSYFLGGRASPWGGAAMAGKIALAHIGAALVLVALFGSAASMFGRPSGVARWLQIASYALVTAAGLWLLVLALADRRRRRAAPHDPAHRGTGGALPFAVGLLPCPMTMLIMTFALAQATILAGLVLVAFLGIGVAITIALVGTLGILFRRGLLRRLDPNGRAFAVALDALQIASALAVLALGSVFLIGSLN